MRPLTTPALAALLLAGCQLGPSLNELQGPTFATVSLMVDS